MVYGKETNKPIQEFINCYITLGMNTKGIELALELIKKYHLAYKIKRKMVE
jgi:hypothetical protein